MNDKILALTILPLLLFALFVRSAENPLPLTAGKPGPVQVTIHPEVVVKAGLPAKPIGVSENLFYSSDKAYPRRRHSQAESLKMIGGKTVRGMEGNIGDFIIWAPPPFSAASPRLTCFQPGRGYFNSFYNPDGTLQKAMGFDEYIQTGQAAGMTEFFYIIGIDAINAEPGEWQWIIPHPLETITAGAAAQARWCKARGIHVWFEIGNENDDWNDDAKLKLRPWEPGKYAAVAIRLSRAIKAEDPEAKVGINGGFSKDWFGRVIPLVWRDIDFLVAHAYWPSNNYAVVRANAALDQAAIPAAVKQQWPLCITETSSYHPGQPVNNDLEEATRNFIRMGLNLYSPRVKYMHFWTDRAADCSRQSGKNAFTMEGDLLPMGQVLAIWNDHLKSQMVKVESSDQEIYAFAARDPQNPALTIFLANQGKTAKSVSVTIAGDAGSQAAELWSFTGTGPQDRNPRWIKQGTPAIRLGKFSLELSPLGFVMVAHP